MKEQLKKFYQDHKNVIDIAARCFPAGVAALTIAKFVDGKRVLSGDILTRDDGATTIVVRHKNGYSTNLTRLPD